MLSLTQYFKTHCHYNIFQHVYTTKLQVLPVWILNRQTFMGNTGCRQNLSVGRPAAVIAIISQRIIKIWWNQNDLVHHFKTIFHTVWNVLLHQFWIWNVSLWYQTIDLCERVTTTETGDIIILMVVIKELRAIRNI